MDLILAQAKEAVARRGKPPTTPNATRALLLQKDKELAELRSLLAEEKKKTRSSSVSKASSGISERSLHRLWSCSEGISSREQAQGNHERR